MFKQLKVMKNERGLTLIELLVVIVIIGIIAAIAVVSIGNIIENSKRDAHITNAQQIVNAAKLYVTTENATFTTTTGTNPTTTLTIKVNGTGTNGVSGGTSDTSLVGKGYLEPVADPSGTMYGSNSQVVVERVNGNLEFEVTLSNAGNTLNYIASENPATLARTDVTLP